MRLCLLIVTFFVLSVSANGQTTYFSREDATMPADWNDPASWTLNPDGSGGPAPDYPRRDDNVVILSGHTILIDATNDNGSPGISADYLRTNLGYTDVGPWNNSNFVNFYHKGDIIIEDGATLDFDERFMFEGTMYVFGDLDAAGDFIVLGTVFMTSTSAFFSTDDLILTHTSQTRIDNASFTNDDLYLDHTSAILCGLGSLEVGLAPNTAEIWFFNGATSDQICSSFDIDGCAQVNYCGTCGGGDTNCPYTGTGAFTIAFPSGGSLVGTGGTLNYVENAIEVVDPGINTSGVTFPFALTGVVEISNNYIQDEDTLALIPTPGFASSWDDVNGILTITGFSDMASWQSALRNVTYENTSDDPTTPSIRTAGFYLSNGLSNTNTVSRNIEITAENDPPGVNTISGSSTPLDYTENDPPVQVDVQITVEDPDDTELEGATISIVSNFQAAEDVLEFADLGNISKVSFTGGVLTLTGTATIAEYETALRSVTYENTSDNPSNAVRTVRFIVNDGDADSPPFDRDINVIPENDPPVVSGAVAPLEYAEGDGEVAIDPSISVDDPDDVDLEGGVVTIDVGFVSSEDVLAFTDQNGISGSWNSTTGELTLTGTATLAEYESALQSITYENTNLVNPDLTTRELSFVMNDGEDNSLPFTKNINLSLTNDAPVLSGSTSVINYTEGDGAVGLDNTFGISDEDDTNLESAGIVITSNYVAEDILSFTPAGSVSGSQTGNTLSLTGSSLIADYVAVLQSLTYENISEDPSEAARTIEITVDDGEALSNIYTITVNISATNDPPVIEPPGGGTTFADDLDYTEGDGAVAILSGTTLAGSDEDDTDLNGATITLGNYVNGEDLLALPAQGSGITGTFDTGTGVLNLTGLATVAEYVTALEAATYENISEDPDATTRTATFQVTDGTNSSTAITRNINVLPVNDKPVITGTGTPLNYSEGDPATVIDGAVMVSDVDDANMESAQVVISVNYQNGEDVLAFADQSGITGNWDAATGILSLTGPASVANYATALASVTYQNISSAPDTGDRTVSFTVSDGDIVSDAFTRNIQLINLVDDPPNFGAIADEVIFYLENDPPVVLSSNVEAFDPDSPTLEGASVSIVANFTPAEDELSFTEIAGISGSYDAANGVLTFTGTAPKSDYTTVLRSVTYLNSSEDPSELQRETSFVLDDGTSLSVAFRVFINISAQNDPPVVSGTSSDLIYEEGEGAVSIDNALDVSDVDNTNLESARISIAVNYASGEDVIAFTDQLGISGSWDSINGILDLTGSAPILDYVTALQSVTYENTSTNPDLSDRTVRFTVSDGDDDALPFDRLISLSAVNDPPDIGLPVIGDYPTLQLNTDEDTPVSAAIPATDPEGDDVFINGVDPLDDIGTLTPDAVDPLGFTYTPAPDFNGIEQFKITVSDDGVPQASDTVLVVINVNPVNDAPVFASDTLRITVNEDEITNICLDTDVSDVDGDDIAITSITPEDTNGTYSPDASGSLCFDFEPVADFNGVSYATVTVSDAATPALSDQAVMEITITNVNDAPVIVDNGTPIDTLYYTIEEDTELDICIEVEDVDGDEVTVTAGDSNPGIGTVDLGDTNDLCFTYLPRPDFFGQDFLLITATDNGEPPLSDDVIIAILITNVDDPPVAVNDTINGLQGETLAGNVLDNDYEPDGDAIVLNTTLVNSPVYGSVNLTQDGNFTYTPEEDYFGADSFVYEICDDTDPVQCSQATVLLIIEEVPKPLLVFQAVSPNGDGFNDTWFIQGISQYPNNSIKLFDRYNQLIYQADNYNNNEVVWRGEALQGVGDGDAPDGTYFYVIDLGDGSSLLKGFLVLRR